MERSGSVLRRGPLRRGGEVTHGRLKELREVTSRKEDEEIFIKPFFPFFLPFPPLLDSPTKLKRIKSKKKRNRNWK